jgi:hypothetical protein
MALLERKRRTMDSKKALESRIKELESIAEFNRKRRVARGGIKGQVFFQDSNPRAALEEHPAGQTDNNTETSNQGAQRNQARRSITPPNPPSLPHIHVDHYVTPVQNIIAAASLAQGITIGEGGQLEIQDAEAMQRLLALVQSAAI